MRDSVTAADIQAVERIAAATGFFREGELEVAVELIRTRVEQGSQSGYHFLFAESEGEVIGFACYGLIPCTILRFDLYWIVVAPQEQRRGIGQRLMEQVEVRVREAGGRYIYIETSGKEQYAPTRNFYQRCGYEPVATLKDFYDDGDDKLIWRKGVALANF